MNILVDMLGRRVYYADTYIDNAEYPVCSFGKVDSLTLSTTNEVKYITVIDNKGRKTNFATEQNIKKENLNALPLNLLTLLNN